MDDIAKLQIRVESLEVAVAEKRLKGLQNQGRKTAKATDGLRGSFARTIGPAAALAVAVGALTKTVSVAREFDVLNAQLITATGNSENAAIAFDAIQQFAADTPYDLQQVTKGFTQLVNLGLTPSERALTSYGDTASAMGKGLSQLVEAVADATTGEFERLKEFGIKTKSEGDNVSFTFRGVTTTVKKNAAEIEGYLIGLGENNFAGAMANRMDTLDGALSNLGDEWDKLWLNISQQSIGDVVEDSVRVAIDVLGELNAILASGEFEGYMDAIALKFGVFAEAAETALNTVYELWNEVFNTNEGSSLGKAVTDTIGFVVDALLNLPENVRAIVKAMAVEFGAFTQYGSIHGEAYGELLLIEFDRILAKAGVVGEGIAAALNPFDEGDFDFGAALDAADKASDDLAKKVEDRVKERLALNDKLRGESLARIFAEREAALKSFDDQIKAAKKLRETYDIKQEKKKEEGKATDALAQFGIKKEDVAATAGIFKELDELFGTTIDKMGEDLATFVVTGKADFKGLADFMIAELARVALKKTFSSIMGSLGGTSGDGGGSSGSGFASILSGVAGLFGGARAEGGPIRKDQFYLVGEKGPELIAPGIDGTVIPNSQMEKQTSVVNHYNYNYNLEVSTPDANSFNRSSRQVRDALLEGN